MTAGTPALAADDTAAIARPRDAENTRQLLLHAARRRFARDGFAAATVRDIAADAGVNVALINRYFASKEGLFEACLSRAVEDLRPERSASSIDQVTETVIAQIADNDAEKSLQLLLLLRSSGDEGADEIRLGTLRQYARGLATVAGWQEDDANTQHLLLRAEVALATSMGVVALRASTALEPLRSASVDDLREPLGALLKALLSPGTSAHPAQPSSSGGNSAG